MNDLIALTIRNIKIFLRDRTAVFFAFLAVIIVFALHLLFLGASMHSWLSDNTVNDNFIRFLSDANTMAGVVVVGAITVSLAMYGNMVNDLEKGTRKGLIVSPIHRSKIVLSYLLSTIACTLALTLLLLFIVQVYIVVNGGHWLNALATVQVIGVLLLTVLSSSAIWLFFIGFIKTTGAFSTATSVVGTLIGFLAGIYMPLAVLPEFVQNLAKLPFDSGTLVLH